MRLLKSVLSKTQSSISDENFLSRNINDKITWQILDWPTAQYIVESVLRDGRQAAKNFLQQSKQQNSMQMLPDKDLENENNNSEL